MAFNPLTPSSTTLAQLRAALRANVETQGALQTITQFPVGAVVNTSTIINYQNMVDEAVAALLNILIANTTGATQTALIAFKTQSGV